MSRTAALLALSKLDDDTKSRIFCSVFPAKKDIEARLDEKYPFRKKIKLRKLDETIVDFVHDGPSQIKLSGVTLEEQTWLYQRCDLFDLRQKLCSTRSGTAVISKDEFWSYNSDTDVTPFHWVKSYAEEGASCLCSICGLEYDLEFLTACKDCGRPYCDDCKIESEVILAHALLCKRYNVALICYVLELDEGLAKLTQ